MQPELTNGLGGQRLTVGPDDPDFGPGRATDETRCGTGVSLCPAPSAAVVATWWVASVIPNAHTTGAENVSCKACAVSAVSGALQLRMNRRAPVPAGRSVRARSNRI